MVLLHNELLQGSTESLDRLRRQAPAGLSGSMQQKVQHTQNAPCNEACCAAGLCCAAFLYNEVMQTEDPWSSLQVDNDGTVVSHGQENGDSSSSESGGSGDDYDTSMEEPQKQPAGPIIDEDGFQLVQKRRGRGKAGQGG